jgi:hypothetical protein
MIYALLYCGVVLTRTKKVHRRLAGHRRLVIDLL